MHVHSASRAALHAEKSVQSTTTLSIHSSIQSHLFCHSLGLVASTVETRYHRDVLRRVSARPSFCSIPTFQVHGQLAAKTSGHGGETATRTLSGGRQTDRETASEQTTSYRVSGQSGSTRRQRMKFEQRHTATGNTVICMLVLVLIKSVTLTRCNANSIRQIVNKSTSAATRQYYRLRGDRPAAVITERLPADMKVYSFGVLLYTVCYFLSPL